MKKITNDEVEIGELTDKKAKLFFELGRDVYAAYLRSEKLGPIMEEKGEQIKDIDSRIHNQLIANKTEASTKAECACSAPLTEDDQFCPQCGRMVEQPDTNEIQTVMCHRCESEVPAAAAFCNVCGVKM